MLLERLFNIYQEEAGDDGDKGGGDGGSLLDGATGGDKGGGEGGEGDKGGEGGDGSWFHADGVQGEGDKPEYLIPKFKTVADQAKAFGELEKKFGAHSGAPEEYDISLPEGASELIGLDPENERVQEFLAASKEDGVSQEYISKAMAFHVAAMEEALGDLIPNREAEVAALGKDAASRINNIADWGKANFDKEQFEDLREITSTAAGVRAVEALISMTKGAKVPTGDTTVNNGMTAEKLREMRYAKDEKSGELKINIDPAYKAEVDKAYKDLYGEGPKKTVVG